MKKFTFFMMSLFLMLGTAMAQNYSLTETGISSEELNAKTAPTLIAIKNLSATNNYYFVGNTGAAPYSAAEFSDAAVFVWQPVQEGVAGSYYLMKLDGTYMQATSPKDFGTVDGAAVFTTTNPTTAGTGSTKFNGDQDSQAFIVDEALLVRFVNKAGTWINVQNGDNGTPSYNSGLGGWTIHHIYAVEEAAVEPEPEVTAGFVHSNTELTLVETTEYPEGITTAKEAEATGEGCTTGVVKSAVTAVNAPAAGNITVAFQYQSGNHKLVMLGVDVLDLDGNVVKGDYHYGFTGGNTQNNTYTIEGIDAGDYQLRYFFCHKADDHEAGNQVAQITVTGLNKREAVEPEPEPEPEPELGEGEVYIYHITAKDAARGALYATSESTHLTHCGATYGNYHNKDIAVNAEDINQQFVFVEYEGVQYLYSLGAQKFAVKDDQYIKLTENPEGFVTVEDADVAGYKLIKFNGQYRLNFSGGYDHGCVANYETPDDGNRLTLTKAGTYNATEIVAAIEAYLNAEAEALAAARAAFDAAYADAAAILTEAALSVTENEVALQTTDNTAAYYLWSNYPEPNEGSINALVDNSTDNGEFFHTQWSNPVPQDTHYLELDLGAGNELAEFVFGYHTRVFAGANDFPDAIQVMGSNDGTNYTEVANITSGLPQAGDKSWKSGVVSSETAYRYYRFNVTAERIYWHMSEFDIFTSEVSVADKYAAVAKEVVALNKAYTDAANNADYDAEALTAAAEAIKACIETINAGVVEPEAPFEVVAVTPAEPVAELTTVTVEFSEEIEGTFDVMGMTQIYLGTKDRGCSFEVNGKVLTITPFNAINTPGEYKLVIPEGLITRKSNGEAVTMNGEYVFTVKEATVEPEPEVIPAANKSYTVVAEGHTNVSRPQWAINDEGTAFVSTGNTTVSTDAQKQFAFVTYEEAIYIYSISAKKFVMKDASLSDKNPDAVQLTELENGKFFFKFDADHNVNIGGSGQMTIDWWSTIDGGNQFTLTEAGDFDATEALALLNTTPEPEAPFEVVAVTPTEAVAELTTVTVEFSEEIEGTFDVMGMTQIYLGTKDRGCSFEVNGKVLTITPFNAINTPGEYKLVIPEGLITRKSNGEAVTMNGEYVFTVKEAVVEPERFTVTAALFPTVEGDVTEIKGIRVEAGQGPALAELPTGWTLTNEAGDEFTMNIDWLYDYETVLIMVNPAITEAGTYTLTIPAGSLKTDDGKECEAAEFNWTIAGSIKDDNTIALIESANELLAIEGVGYPATTPREALKAAIAAAEEKPDTEAGTALQAAIDAYYATTDVVLPEGDKVYSLTMVAKNGNKFYLNYTGSDIAMVARTTDEELPNSAKFAAEDNGDGTISLKTIDGKYLVYHSKYAGLNWLQGGGDTDGLQETKDDMTNITFAKMVNGDKVEATGNEQIFGMLTWYGKRGYDTGKSEDCYGYMVLKTDGSDYDGASVPFWNDNYSSAFIVEETEYIAEPLNVVAVTPAEDEVVNSLREITIEFDAEIAVKELSGTERISIDYGWGVFIGTTATVEGKLLKLVADTEIKDNGTYPLTIPAGVVTRVSDGVAYEGGTFTFTVEKAAVVVEPLTVVAVTPAESVEKLETITIEFSDKVDVPATASGKFTIADADGNNVATLYAWDAAVDGKVVTLTLTEAITEAGEYTFSFAEGLVTRQGDGATCAYTCTINVTGVVGIDSIYGEAGDCVIYDITGRKIEKITEGGIYIVNGKKVLVK